MIIQDVVRNGILPMAEIIARAHSGHIPPKCLGPLFIARQAEDLACGLADDCWLRHLLLSIVEAVEDWFRELADQR